MCLGSCGLEYTLDYTEAGRARKTSSGYDFKYKPMNNSKGHVSWFPFILIVGAIALLIYKMTHSQEAADSTQPTQPVHPQHPQGSNIPPPPPYGFKPEYAQGNVALNRFFFIEVEISFQPGEWVLANACNS